MTVSFAAHVALLDHFLDRRQEVVEQIERRLLNVRGKPITQQRDRRLFEQVLDECFFGLPGLPRGLAQLKGQLAATHLADGFEPVPSEQYAQDLDPLEFVVRAYQHWEAHRWPGGSGRLTFAHCLFAMVLVRELEYLSLRIWDGGLDQAGDRLDEVQSLLDRVNSKASPAVFVRDARWLIHAAQGSLTKHLAPYFRVAGLIASSLTPSSRIELHRAGAMLTSGHLRSQLRYRVWETSLAVGDADILAIARNSNSMDCALLVHDLVPLLEAYEAACQQPDLDARLALADAILQGLSADPELLLVRLDLLTPSTMIEDLFIERGPDGTLRYSALGDAHLTRVTRYGALVGRLAGSLRADADRLDPAHHQYSPFGITYGFCADILSNMAHGVLVGQPSSRLSLEDAFAARTTQDAMLARSRALEALPRLEGERQHFEFSAQWAGQVFTHLTEALDARVGRRDRANASTWPKSRLFVVAEGLTVEALPPDALPAGVVSAQQYCLTSDPRRAAAGLAAARAKGGLVDDRNEARYLASVETDGTWFAISKAIVTLVTSRGQDALITDVPPAVVDVLRLTCPGSYLCDPACRHTDAALWSADDDDRSR